VGRLAISRTTVHRESCFGAAVLELQHWPQQRIPGQPPGDPASERWAQREARRCLGRGILHATGRRRRESVEVPRAPPGTQPLGAGDPGELNLLPGAGRRRDSTTLSENPREGPGRGGAAFRSSKSAETRRVGALVMPSEAVLEGRGFPLQTKSAGLPGITRQRVGLPLKILTPPPPPPPPPLIKLSPPPPPPATL
jgi:hypothetical protein